MAVRMGRPPEGMHEMRGWEHRGSARTSGPAEFRRRSSRAGGPTGQARAIGVALCGGVIALAAAGCAANVQDGAQCPPTAAAKSALRTSCCSKLPSPLPVPKCATDAQCRVGGVLPAACLESKCVSNVCQFRPPFTTLCRCVPGAVQVCTMATGGRGIQVCLSNTQWGACSAACSSC